MTEKSVPLAGVIGSPIAHSKSPALHGYWLKKYGIRGHYIPIELTRESFESGLKSLPALGFRGVNVTLPFKEMTLTIADVISDRAALIGAANTITFRKDGRIHADNTDGYGFIANLKQNAPNWRADAGPALVLGAGGASRAIISSLLGEGAPVVLLSNRTKNRAEMLAEHFGARVRVVDWTRFEDRLSEVSTLVNTTQLGMAGQPELHIDLSNLKNNSLVTDIVYSPLETALLTQARAKGFLAVDGLGMLLHQAVPGFENWFQQRPKVDDELRRTVLEA